MKNDIKQIKILRMHECNFGDNIEYNNSFDENIVNDQLATCFNKFTITPANVNVTVNITNNINTNNSNGNKKVKIIKKNIGNSANKVRKK